MSIQRRILVGSVWAIAMRWAVRLLGMVSVVVLARLLQPEDFGLVAMAMLLVGALATFGELGAESMVIRETNVTPADLDTAWTIRLAQHVALAAMVSALAPLAAAYFGEPRVRALVYLGAAALAINGLENIGVVLFRKRLDFAADFRYQVVVKLSGVITTITLAFLLRSYWALALAQPVAAIANVAASYALSSHRPWFGLSNWRRYLAFSANMVLANVARFSYNKADVFLVASIGTPSQMGLYNVAADLSSMPSREFTSSVGRAMFPSLAAHRQATGGVVEPFLHVLASVAALSVPIGVGLWAVADDAVRVLLGERWSMAGPLMRYLAIYGMLASIIDIMLGHVMIVTGHERRQTMLFWLRFALLGGCVLVGARGGLTGIALGAAVSSVLTLLAGIAVLNATLGTRWGQYVAILWRPALAALAMAMAVLYVAAAMPDVPALRLLAGIACGIVAYFAALALLWLAAGRPAGVERAALNSLREFRNRRP